MYQSTTVVGNLGADPEMRFLPNGDAVTNFSLAANRKWTNKNTGAKEEEVIWFRVSVFRAQAEAVNQYMKKGSQVLVEGRLRPDDNGGPRLWTAQDGTVRASFELTANSVKFLSGGNAEASSGQPASGTPAAAEDDEIPF